MIGVARQHSGFAGSAKSPTRGEPTSRWQDIYQWRTYKCDNAVRGL